MDRTTTQPGGPGGDSDGADSPTADRDGTGNSGGTELPTDDVRLAKRRGRETELRQLVEDVVDHDNEGVGK